MVAVTAYFELKLGLEVARDTLADQLSAIRIPGYVTAALPSRDDQGQLPLPA